MKNIEKTAKEILAKYITVPEFSSNEELAKWVEKQPIDSRFLDAIFDLDSGEILLEPSKRLTKYEHYAIPRKLRNQPVRERSKLVKLEEDPRKENVFSLSSFNKYYKIQDKGNGVFVISRTDLKPFEDYDVDNIKIEFFSELNRRYLRSFFKTIEQFVYDSEPEDLKVGKKYFVVKPSGLNKNFIFENFEDFYEIKSKPLKTWFEKGMKYPDYDGDAEIPIQIIKTDKTSFSKDDIEIINMYLKRQNKDDQFGGANIEFSAKPGTKVLNENNLIMMMVR